MAAQRLGIIMHGITGRMGYNQHLVRSICAIRAGNGVLLSNGDRVMPDPILVGRNREKVAALAKGCGIARVAESVDEALGNSDDTVFFDAGSTTMRFDLLTKAIKAGKRTFAAAGGPRAYFGDPAAATGDEGARHIDALGSILEEAVRAEI